MLRSISLCFVFFLIGLGDAYPAIRTWDGGGSDANWTTAANWEGDVAPSANDDLVFPATAAQYNMNNNYLILTTFRSIRFDGGTYTLGGNLFRLTHGMNVAAGTQTINTGVTLSAAQTLTAGQGATLTLLGLSIGNFATEISGDGLIGIGLISGSGAVTKTGSGAALILAASGFSSPISLLNGILIVDANIPNSTVTVNSNTTTGFGLSGLGGTGTVGSTNVIQGGISAGSISSPTGILTISGGLTLSQNGAFACKIAGTTPGSGGYDQLNVLGPVVLNDSLLAPVPWDGFVPSVGDEFVIINNDGSDPVSGTFLDLPEGAIFAGPLNTAFRISYVGGTGNDVTIRRVPRASFDFDGDGKTDIGTYSGTTWSVRRSSNGQTVQTPFGIPTDIITPADFDGDNRTDIAVFRPSEGIWYVLNSATDTVSIDQFGANGDIPVPNDFDGDGRADRTIYRPSEGVWFQFRSLGQQYYAAQFGLNGDTPLVMDHDGDGLGDLAIFRPSDGTWHFWLSTTNSYLAFPFGQPGDLPVAGDFNADGKTDIAMFRPYADPAFADFYVLISGTYDYYGVAWGVPNDVPVIGDYDGDGRSDIAVFRPSSNDWYVLRSSGGFDAVTFGNINDTPIPSAYVR
ncbi:FG-GAP repeat domain-containing protein [Leptolyngbya sp. 7M]|uniref:FG-GAP repeat domain-containing protein n=1 Tax=Leptolyngbya sp. 7M TaxID=2812896 RepID=UPI001B8D9CE2|nr:VCBS repeat-containing protein [Leptolyngbya sp. 7M]QYO65841.1 VCBS repeat-containing protein [Leptolyngbya sp. 7M]